MRPRYLVVLRGGDVVCFNAVDNASEEFLELARELRRRGSVWGARLAVEGLARIVLDAVESSICLRNDEMVPIAAIGIESAEGSLIRIHASHRVVAKLTMFPERRDNAKVLVLRVEPKDLDVVEEIETKML